MAYLDLIQVQENLQVVLQGLTNGGEAAFQHVFLEGSELEIGNISNMPLANVRLLSTEEVLTRLPNGYDVAVNLAIDIIAFDFTSYASAARIRGQLLKIVKDALLANPNFDAQLLSSQWASGVQFSAFGVEGNRGHIAMASATVVCNADVEA